MPPRSLSERSPVSVMQWDEATICIDEMKPTGKAALPLSKSVQFQERHDAFPIPHLDDIPDKEVEATWYSAKEYSEIKASYQVTIFMMESGEPITGDDQTPRGLEYRTQEGAWARYENKRDAYNAVLDEQDRQWKVDKDDFEKIREIYLQHSTKCAQAAVVRALQDHSAILEYIADADALLKPKKKKKKKIILVKKKKKGSSGDSVASTNYESDGNQTDTSNKSNRSTKSVSKKKAKEITKKLKKRASNGSRSNLLEKNSLVVHEDKSLRRRASASDSS